MIETGFLRRNHWYHIVVVGNKTYLNGMVLVWWRKLCLWVNITILILIGKEKF